MLLEATRWTHLPVTGGWHEQHPMLIDEFMILFDEKGKHEARQIRDQERMNSQNAAREQALQTGVPYIH